MQVRNGESGKTWFRCERYFHTDKGWFVSTREHDQLGPFENSNEAENELNLYIRHQNESLFAKPKD